eukprot:5281875-Alexandrium_andersonii.AAC.1
MVRCPPRHHPIVRWSSPPYVGPPPCCGPRALPPSASSGVRPFLFSAPALWASFRSGVPNLGASLHS